MRRTVRRGLLLLTTATVLILGWPGPGAQAAAYLSHRSAVDVFRDAGISIWSSGNCSNRNKPSCTSFERIRRSTVDGVLTLRKASRCDLRITGGTETGHGSGTYSHWNGWKIDISKYTCIGKYIKRYFKYVGYIRGWGYQYKAPSGNIYTDEGNHWDILYYSCGGCSGGDDDDKDLVPSPSAKPSASPKPAASPAPSASPSRSPSQSVSPSTGPSAAAAPIAPVAPVASAMPSASPGALHPSAVPSASASGANPAATPSAPSGGVAPSPDPSTPQASPVAGPPSAAPGVSVEPRPSGSPSESPWPSGSPVPWPSGSAGPSPSASASAVPLVNPALEPPTALPPPPVHEPVPQPTKLLRAVDPAPASPPPTLDPAQLDAPLG
ncbi:hypothetical protein CS0771_70610 [Catellatospora sp. IY07-71]|uniref:hypothetical protein n=1 Tax=Catellatospora sp. IY07-71 TaxID=2728827 RepID=UPI001BB4492D|nr:hypothetical protein [Catellatospora sp. IY07-71]BCJ77517.1 hypothetical protein CS0771_70610 [Catellatospora sp. IY07-71]